MKNQSICNLLSCFCICFLCTAVLNQYSLSPGPVVYVINGSNVTFTCSITKKWNVTYVFDHGIKDSNLARVIFQGNSTHCRPLYIETLFGADKYSALPCNVGQPVSFIVRYITASYHNKSISCKVDAGQLISTTVKIREKITSPKIDPDGMRTVEDGTFVSFRCTATSIPKSSIVWYVNGTKLTGIVTTSSSAENNMISTISYLAKKEHYNMNLFCSANDSFTTMNSLSAILNILYVPTVHIDPGYNPFILYAGQQNVILTCAVDDGNPSVGLIFHWINVGGIVKNNTIAITTVSSTDSGQYICMAENSVGNSSVSFTQLKVQYGPLISNIVNIQGIIEGNNLTVLPIIDSDPTSEEIWWTRQTDANFRYHSSVLQIHKINRTSSGNYTCHAMNTLTPSGMLTKNITTQKTFYVNVQYVPTVHIEPEYNPYILYAGQQNVILTCVVDDANPPEGITFHWTNVGGTVNNNTVFISTVSKADSGQYTCIAESRVGNSSTISKHLTVQYGPFVSNITHQDVIEGNDLIVFPEINAYPAARLVWWSTQNDQNFRYDGSELKINNIHRTSSGYYTCHVINTLTPSGMSAINMTTEKSFYVNVQFKPSLDYTRPYSPSHITAIENITLVITVIIVANPTPTIEWTFKEQADLNSCNFSTICSNTTTNGFRTSSSIAIDHVQSRNFGEYTLTARSTVGIFFRRFVVNTEGEANLPTLAYVICKSTSATVIWQHVFNGGSSLDFYIQFAEKGQYVKTEILQLNNTMQPMIYEVTALKPNSKYNFSIIAVNVLVEFKSQTLECITDAPCLQKERCELRNEHTSMFVAGIATLVIGLLSLTTAVFFIVRTSLKIKACESSKSDEYTDVNRSNPAFADAYTPLQSDIESRPSQEQSVNTYEECRRTEAHAYISLGTMEPEPRKAQEQTVKTYEECRNKSEAHAYDTLGKVESEPRQTQTVNTYEGCRSKSEAHAYDTLGKVESEPRPAQVQTVNTYEECRSNSEAHAYDTLGKVESGQKNSQKKQDNLKI